MLTLARLLSSLLDALAPPCCAACDGTADGVFCDACAARVRACPGELIDGVPLLVGGNYAAPLSDAIVRFKYQGRAELAAGLGSLLAPRLAAAGLPARSVLVPVPLHARRLAKRGYNQAALLAHALGSATGFACAPRLLVRRRETERQVGKSRALRLTNADGAFEVNERQLARLAKRSEPERPAQVVLVDDVVTTGSTVRACAQALATAGARLVAVAAVARAHAD